MDDLPEPYSEEWYEQSKSREDWVRELGDEEWDIHTLLEAHAALVDRRDRVRFAAAGALMELAEKDPEPVAVTPLMLLRSYVRTFTATSGSTQQFYRFLLDLKTDEADRILHEILSDTDHMRNKDFENLIRYLIETDEKECLKVLEGAELSNKKGKIFRRVKREAGLEN